MLKYILLLLPLNVIAQVTLDSSNVLHVMCNGACTGSITLYATGIHQPFDYSIDVGVSFQSSNQFSNLCAGSYTCIVKDTIGATDTVVYVVGQPDAIGVQFQTTPSTCQNSCDGKTKAVTSGGLPPYSYIFNSGNVQTADSIGGLCAGTVMLSITDYNGCVSNFNDNVAVQNFIYFNVNTINPTLCNSATGSIELFNLTPYTAYGISYMKNGQMINPVSMTSDNGGKIVISGLTQGIYSNIKAFMGGCHHVYNGTVVLEDPGTLMVDISGINKVHPSCEMNDGQISGVNVTGGTSPYNYLWSNLSTSDTLKGVGPGNYFVQISDAANCAKIAGPMALNPPLNNVNVNVSKNDVSCFAGCDGAAIVTGSGGTPPYDFHWSSGHTTALAPGLCPGKYVVHIKDANNCKIVREIEINQPPAFGMNIIPTLPECDSANGLAELVLDSIAVAPFKVRWSNGDSTLLADSLKADVYMVGIKDDAGCMGVRLVPIPSVGGPSISINPTAPSCFNTADGSIEISVNGGTPPFDIRWTNGQTGYMANGLRAGRYGVAVKDVEGCVSFQMIELVGPQPIDVTIDNLLLSTCGNSDGAASVSVNGGVAPYNFSWSTGTSITGQVSNLSAGMYSVTISDANSCEYTKMVWINDLNGPNPIVAGIMEPGCGDFDGHVEISISGGSAPYTYNWSNGSANEGLHNVAIGGYDLTVSDLDGCIGMLHAEVRGLNLAPQEICMVSVDTASGANLVVWEKNAGLGIAYYQIFRESDLLGEFNLIATIPFDDLSEFADTTANSGSHPSRYKLVTVDSCGNKSVFMAVHKTIHLVVHRNQNAVHLMWDNYIGFDYTRYYINRFTPQNGWEVIDSVPFFQHHYIDFPGSIPYAYYSVEARPDNPCSAWKIVDHNNTRSNKGVVGDIENSVSEYQLMDVLFYPNPAQDKFEIYASAQILTVEIRNLEGKLIQALVANAKSVVIETSGLANGIYLVGVKDVEGNIRVEKIAVSK